MVVDACLIFCWYFDGVCHCWYVDGVWWYFDGFWWLLMMVVWWLLMLFYCLLMLFDVFLRQCTAKYSYPPGNEFIYHLGKAGKIIDSKVPGIGDMWSFPKMGFWFYYFVQRLCSSLLRFCRLFHTVGYSFWILRIHSISSSDQGAIWSSSVQLLNGGSHLTA